MHNWNFRNKLLSLLGKLICCANFTEVYDCIMADWQLCPDYDTNATLYLTVGMDFGQETIESAAVFLFKIFYNKDQVGHEETRAIKQMFGPFPSSAAGTSCAAIGRLVALVDGTKLETFVLAHSSNAASGRVPFGRNISFSFDSYALDYLEGLPWDSLEEDDISLDFGRFLTSQARQNGTVDGAIAGGSGHGATPAGAGVILQQEVECYLAQGHMSQSSPEELCSSLFEMLASQKTDDELQNEVGLDSVPENTSVCSLHRWFITSRHGLSWSLLTDRIF